MKFADLLAVNGDTSTAIQAAIDRAEQEASAAAAQLDELTQGRLQALLADDDKALDQIERRIALALRSRDRADLAISELQRRFEAAQERELQEQRDSVLARGQQAQKRGADLLRSRYAKLAQPLITLADELSNLAAQIDGANQELRRLGDQRQIGWPEDLLAPPGARPATPFRLSFLRELCLPDPTRPGTTLYPALPEERAA